MLRWSRTRRNDAELYRGTQLPRISIPLDLIRKEDLESPCTERALAGRTIDLIRSAEVMIHASVTWKLGAVSAEFRRSLARQIAADDALLCGLRRCALLVYLTPDSGCDAFTVS